MTRASPWDALLKLSQPVTLAPSTPAEPPAPREDSKVAQLLGVLAVHSSFSTLSLCVACDLTSRQVWGLLKGPRAAGQVTYEAGRWALVPDYPGADVQRAVELLRSKGWVLTAPATKNG